jgi:phosphoribosyl 1,2-cyclic phosphodiesterase
MKITFLGTGAADWCRALHKNVDGYRRNAAVLIDDCLLIDCGPDVPDALATFGKSADSIRYVINSHRHSDHYHESTLACLPNAKLCPTTVGSIVTVGKYTVEVLPANHATCPNTVHFLVSDGEKRLFYGLDGAWLLYDEVKAIQKQGVDLAIIEATVGDVCGDYRIFEHNNLTMVVELKNSLAPYVGRWFISHMAKTLHTSHAELEQNMKPHGIEVAFDGCEVIL